MDLKQQYETLMRQELRSLGCNKQLTDEQLEKRDKRDSSITSQIEGYELSLLSNFFYSVTHRLFIQKPRQVIKYRGFDDKGNSIGIANLEKKITKGDSLVPHLSKSIFDIDQAKNNDSMLNEWSIYHFHIPTSDGNGAFVTRSNDLLFAIITNEKFIFLDIQPHSDSAGTYEPWVDIKIIEKIEQHYPELLEQHFLGEGKVPFTAEQRQNLRARNANTNIITSSGKEYRIPGCCSVAAGLPVNAVIKGDMAMNVIRGLSEGSGNSSVTLSFDDNYGLVAASKRL
ncbi:hypothetical protein HQQ94_06295 [Shewanella sp. VB17]|uniref:hypothetical protein n=1 Tax=Shewanella sp. VB17 TaxID=2739432 RepID=UPI001566BD26|nr:hypothetical protein [Shewanella sp. VB17]NRD72853.1 hypothetical protein [Shewanella sp. VB17]